MRFQVVAAVVAVVSSLVSVRIYFLLRRRRSREQLETIDRLTREWGRAWLPSNPLNSDELARINRERAAVSLPPLERWELEFLVSIPRAGREHS